MGHPSHRQIRMRSTPLVAQHRRRAIHMQPNAIPIAERLALHNCNRRNLLQMRALQSLPQDLHLHLQLLRVARLLIVASAAFAEVSAWRRNPRGGSLHHTVQLRAGIARAIFGNVRFHHLARQRKRNEDRLAVGARKSRSAIDCFFDAQLHPEAPSSYKTGSDAAAHIFPAGAYAETAAPPVESVPSACARDTAQVLAHFPRAW